MKIEIASFKDKNAIAKIALEHKDTRSFNSPIYSGERSFSSGMVIKAMVANKIVGFACFRHLIRKPYTSVYFMGVTKDFRRSGIGKKLLLHIVKNSPRKAVRLLVDNDNDTAVKFYKSLSFKKAEKKNEKSTYWELRI